MLFREEESASPSNFTEKRDEGIKFKLSRVFAANLRSNPDKCSGAHDENWTRYLTALEEVCNEAELSASDKVQFLRHLIRGEALDFYYSHIID